jgi:hypothetical protein
MRRPVDPERACRLIDLHHPDGVTVPVSSAGTVSGRLPAAR